MDQMANIDLLLEDLHKQSGHIASLEGRWAENFASHGDWTRQAEEHLRQALILLEEAAA